MILPSGINKATGLLTALDELDLSAHNVVAVGDAENDHAFLMSCGCAATVANAVPMVRAEVDIPLAADHGAGVVELVDRLIHEDAALAPKATHGILVGSDQAGNDTYLEPSRGMDPRRAPQAIGAAHLPDQLADLCGDRGPAHSGT
jgi:hypothetical protein